jgi:glycosyltransferase involved in cell wall biosynthesis
MLSGEYPPRHGGVGDYTARLVAALGQQGYLVRVLTSAHQPPDPTDPDAPPAWRRVRSWGIGCFRNVERAVEAAQADLLHLQYQAGAYELKGAIHLLPRWLRWRRPRLQVVTTFHDLLVPYLFPKAGRLRELAVRELLRSSQGAIFCDSADLARAEPGPNHRWVPAGSNIPCAPPADFERKAVRRALGAADDDLLIGYFGFLSAGKGATTLLEALNQLRSSGRSVRLALIGATGGSSNPSDAADQAEALALAERLGLAAQIQTTGFLEAADVSAHLLACDLLALPYRDGASFRRGSLLAALEHGCPIVTTLPGPAAAGLGERRLEPGRQFLGVGPDDPAALAAAIARLAGEPALAARLGGEARALAARLSWAAIARETAEVYAAAMAAGQEQNSLSRGRGRT